MKYDILVTGGLGYIGSHFIKHIKNKFKKILVIDNFCTGSSDYILKNFEVINSDLKNQSDLKACLKDKSFKTVVHFAAHAYVGESTKNCLKYAENNISGLINLLKICEEVKVDNFVFSSSCATYGSTSVDKAISENFKQDPINPYGWTKLVCEQLLKQLNTNIKIGMLRYFNAAGNDKDCIIGEDHNPETHVIPLIVETALSQKFPDKFPKKKFTIFGNNYNTPDGTCLRDYIHVIDLCEAHLKCIEKLIVSPSGTNLSLNLGAGRGISILEIIREVEKKLDISMKYNVAEKREGDPPKLVADVSLAKKILGFNCKNSHIKEILEDVINYKLNKMKI